MPPPSLPPKTNPASPLYYDSSQTALILLDFHTFVINLCGSNGQAAFTQAQQLRAWALKHKILIQHSLVDFKGLPAPTCKGAERVNGLLKMAQGNDAEPAGFFPTTGENGMEMTVRKQPGIVSGLKSRDDEGRAAIDILAEHGIKSLVFSGLSTSGAVLKTALPAADDGFVITVVKDACAEPEGKELLHEVIMGEILPSRCWVVDGAGEWVGGWEEAQVEA